MIDGTFDDDDGHGPDGSDRKEPTREPSAGAQAGDIGGRGSKVRASLKANLGDDIYTSWFGSLEFVSFDGHTLKVSVAVKFLKTWIESHYLDAVLRSAAIEFKGVERIEIVVREPTSPVRSVLAAGKPAEVANGTPATSAQRPSTGRPMAPSASRTESSGLEGSPLDPRYTFESFIVGAANRMAHAGAIQVAETVLSESRGFNPLFIHSAVGHGKSHLLQAIAWEVRRRTPSAVVVYMTAEKFRFQFVEALRSHDALAFKDYLRSVDMLLVDDLEFMYGEQTEMEFDHIINSLLDGGRQLVVASARPPSQLSRLNDRMRSRLQRGLVTEIHAHDYELRLKILERRVREKRASDPSFEIPQEVIEFLAERLTESGRELEGAVTRLYAAWQVMQTRITLDLVENMVRDLANGSEPRRIKIEDILRLVSRHFGVSKGDILSQRRHRSVVWPRQIGMYLAKQLTTRSLPEIGRRFGNRDHTTVLHAIRKIEGEISGDSKLKDELEELKKQLNT